MVHIALFLKTEYISGFFIQFFECHSYFKPVSIRNFISFLFFYFKLFFYVFKIILMWWSKNKFFKKYYFNIFLNKKYFKNQR